MLSTKIFKSLIKRISTFDDIYNVTKNLNTKDKGDFFEYISYYLFKLDPRQNNGLQNVWLYNDIPNKIKKDLSLPEKDMGIDLLLQKDDEYYAVQCKYRQDPDQTITWKELSTFFSLAFGINNKIKGGFFVANTNEINKNILKSQKVISLYDDYFNDLPSNFFENICNSIDDTEMIMYEKKTPFNHQRTCISKSVKHFKKKSRGHIEMACGTDKLKLSKYIQYIYFSKRIVYK